MFEDTDLTLVWYTNMADWNTNPLTKQQNWGGGEFLQTEIVIWEWMGNVKQNINSQLFTLKKICLKND